MQRAVQTLKRELEKLGCGGFGEVRELRRVRRCDRCDGCRGSLDSYKYVGFEDQFRGSQHDIRERVAAYVPACSKARAMCSMSDAGAVNFSTCCVTRGISARGVDLNDEMAAVCRERGLDATAGDALSYLLAQPDGSLGGLFAAQVVEHLEPDYLMRFLDAAYHKLRPGSKIVLETINPACWFAFFSSYIRDITHVRPLHPDTLQYLVGASGFQKCPFATARRFRTSRSCRLCRSDAGLEARHGVAVFNDNVRKLNSLLFTYLDYAAIGERLYMRDMWRYIHARTVVRVVARLKGPVPDRTADLQQISCARRSSSRPAFSILQVGRLRRRVERCRSRSARALRARARRAARAAAGPVCRAQKLWAGSPRVVPDSRGALGLDRRAAAVRHRRRVQAQASVSRSGVVVLSIAGGAGVQPVCLAAVSGLHHVGPVPTVDWRTLVQRYGRFDFVAIDAEGYDAEILHQIDLKESPPAIILYEHVAPAVACPKRCEQLLRSNGYAVTRVNSQRHARDAIGSPGF